MPKIEYRMKRFREKTLITIATANKIIADYAEQGFDLTLRQLYYQFVARDLIPNTERSYHLLGNTINDGRLAGFIDWNSIVDRTRSIRGNSHWDSPQQIVESCAAQYKIDKWQGQEHRVEVWIEKDALVGVLTDICEELDVNYFSCRGYVSQSEMWRAGFGRFMDDVPTIILHLGDHDPSGIDMTRDIEERLSMFAYRPVEVRRIALNMNQIKKYNPPPNPAKMTDARFQNYALNYGEHCWELDALEPPVLVKLIRREVEKLRDDDLFLEMREREEDERRVLRKVVRSLKKSKK